MQGLETAESQGLIVQSTITHHDRHSHLPPLGSLGHFNTRGLDATCAMLLANIEEGSQALVLGGGTGTACDDIKVKNPNLRVEAVSFTPFNPYARILIREYDIYARVKAIVGEKMLLRRRAGTTYDEDHQQKLARYRAMPDAIYAKFKSMVSGSEPRTDHDSHVPTTLIEELQKDGMLRVFEPLDHFICDRQHIAHFPDTFSSTKPFDLVYDDRGPLYYVDEKKCGTPQDATVNAVRLLSPKGLLFATNYDQMNRAAGVRDALGSDYSEALFLLGNSGLAVVMEQHRFHSALRSCVKLHDLHVESGVVHVGPMNMQDLIRNATHT